MSNKPLSLMKIAAAAPLILCGSAVGLLVAQVGAEAFEKSELRKVAENSALAAARDLPLFNANPQQIQNMYKKLTGCRMERDPSRSFTLRDGDMKIETVLIDNETGVQVIVIEQWKSTLRRLASMPAKEISVKATVRLLGAGEVQSVQATHQPLASANGPSKRCGV